LDVVHDDGDLASFLVGDVSQHDIRAEYCTDSLKIISVDKIEGRGSYALEYSYEWSAYYGCRDMCKGDTEYDSMTFRYWGELLIFKKTVIEPRSTYDEL